MATDKKIDTINFEFYPQVEHIVVAMMLMYPMLSAYIRAQMFFSG